jgi:hypothetical protein
MLSRLLDQIDTYRNVYDITVAVFDDGSSDTRYYQRCFYGGIDYYRSATNGGKKKYYDLVNKAFACIPDADYYFMLPDDMELSNGYFSEAITTWRSINDARKICLNTDVDARAGKEQWTQVKTVDKGNVWQTQWMDMCFMSERLFFQQVGRISIGDRWKTDETLGSGVGAFISRALNTKRYGMYQVKKSLVNHGNHESRMNPNQTNKLPSL